MVSQHYDLDLMEKNREAFVRAGRIATAPGFRASLKTRKQRMRA